ncbi:MAG TPA: RepB family plasmid replication initiator protein, partial [Lutibacter sp.]|nr:RepB family plasmid replication initiator protein [Lutibacter sp.]
MSDRKIVRKNRDLILAKNTWSETEAKLFATLIKELNPKDETDFRLMNIQIKEIEDLWGKKQVHTTRIRNTCLELQTKAYEIPQYRNKDYPDKLTGYKYVNLFDEIEYKLEERKITFEFSRQIKPYILEFTKRFVAYNIENILSFKSKYSISFYE